MLLIGYGNPGRGDDGLGPAFVGRIAARALQGIDCQTDYQLTVDHAFMAASAPTVVFVDAMMTADEPFAFSALHAADDAGLTSHRLTPASVLMLSRTLFAKAPKAFLLGISGRDFGEMREGLSAEACYHLQLAEAFFTDWHAKAAASASRARSSMDA